MNIKDLRETVHTYKDFELKTMLRIAGWCENRTKEKILRKEIKRRQQDDYNDNTMDPKVPIRSRLQNL